MTDEAWKASAVIVPSIVAFLSVLLSRLWSMWEHKKTGQQVNKIYMIMNGELEKKLAEAREEGRNESKNLL